MVGMSTGSPGFILLSLTNINDLFFQTCHELASICLWVSLWAITAYIHNTLFTVLALCNRVIAWIFNPALSEADFSGIWQGTIVSIHVLILSNELLRLISIFEIMSRYFLTFAIS